MEGNEGARACRFRRTRRFWGANARNDHPPCAEKCRKDLDWSTFLSASQKHTHTILAAIIQRRQEFRNYYQGRNIFHNACSNCCSNSSTRRRLFLRATGFARGRRKQVAQRKAIQLFAQVTLENEFHQLEEVDVVDVDIE